MNILYRVNVGKLTSLKVGGQAPILYIPKTECELQNILFTYPTQVKRYILGKLTNILIGDKGLDGIALMLDHMPKVLYAHGNHIWASAATTSIEVARFAQKNHISGFEFLQGIPGSIGGAVAMNAGIGQTHCMEQITQETNGYRYNGHPVVYTNKELQFSYRYAHTEDMIITGVHMAGYGNQSKKIIEYRTKKILNKRKQTQPQKVWTAGSTFKNTPQYAAGYLIEFTGLKGYTYGDLQMSAIHANFMVNRHGFGTAYQARMLGELVRKHVLKKMNIYLEWEIKHIGVFL